MTTCLGSDTTQSTYLVLVTSLVVIALHGEAAAQSATLDVQSTPQPQPQSQLPIAEVKSPHTALGISLGVTMAGIVLGSVSASRGHAPLAFSGLGLASIGPSTGRWYSGSIGAGSLALRALGGLSTVTGIAVLVAAGEADSPGDYAVGAGLGLFVAGTSLWVATSVYDFIRAGREARSYNRARALRVAPMLHAASNVQVGGIAVQRDF